MGGGGGVDFYLLFLTMTVLFSFGGPFLSSWGAFLWLASPHESFCGRPMIRNIPVKDNVVEQKFAVITLVGIGEMGYIGEMEEMGEMGEMG